MPIYTTHFSLNQLTFCAYFTNIYPRCWKPFPSWQLRFFSKLSNKSYWLFTALFSKEMVKVVASTIILRRALRYCLGHSGIGPKLGSAATVSGNAVTCTLQIWAHGSKLPSRCNTLEEILRCNFRKDATAKFWSQVRARAIYACMKRNSVKNAVSSDKKIVMTSTTFFEHSFLVQDNVQRHSDHLKIRRRGHRVASGRHSKGASDKPEMWFQRGCAYMNRNSVTDRTSYERRSLLSFSSRPFALLLCSRCNHFSYTNKFPLLLHLHLWHTNKK